MKINGDGGWVSLGGQWSSIPIVGRNQDGRLEIFIVGQSEKLYHRYQTSPNNSNGWNDKWEDLGGKWNANPVVANNADGRLEIFIVGQSEKLYHTWQISPSNGWI
jgi:acylphosphatase